MGRRGGKSKLKSQSLFVWACERMTSAMIVRLARCDLGGDHRAQAIAINEIVESCRVPGDLQWAPGEPCGLWRWSPERWKSREEHVINVFSTCVLLVAGVSDECVGRLNNCGVKPDTLASLAWSVVALNELNDEAMSFFDWLDEQPERCENPRSYVVLAKLIIAVERGDSAEQIESLGSAWKSSREGEQDDMRHYRQHEGTWRQLCMNAHAKLAARADAGDVSKALSDMAEFTAN